MCMSFLRHIQTSAEMILMVLLLLRVHHFTGRDNTCKNVLII